jgi:hypothetical protein
MTLSNKRNPIGDEFDNNVIDEIARNADSIGDHLFLARTESDRLNEYIKEYDDGSWKFEFMKDVAYEIWKIEKKFHKVARIIETFKDPEE